MWRVPSMLSGPRAAAWGEFPCDTDAAEDRATIRGVAKGGRVSIQAGVGAVVRGDTRRLTSRVWRDLTRIAPRLEGMRPVHSGPYRSVAWVCASRSAVGRWNA